MGQNNGEETLTIPANHSVHGCDLDADEPWCEIRPDEGDMEPATKLRVPKALAYYLRHHWCGSDEMHKRIVSNTKREIRNGIRDLLEIEDDQ